MNDNNALEEQIKAACLSHSTMKRAAKSVGIAFTTFKRLAIRFNVYRPNPSGKGTHKKERSRFTEEGLNSGKFPNAQSYKLKKWLIKHGLKKNQCECCGITEWQGNPIECTLHHKDGNKHNNKISNLQILCPNCHSQTDTFTAKNWGKYKRNKSI